MSDPLDLVHLRTVVAIADCGGFHRAAAALHLSQSTVSQHVRQLERILDQPLVQKVGRGTRFTVAGDALLGEARRILAVHDQALQRLEVRTGPTMLIGCTEHTAGVMLPLLARSLKNAFPGRSARFRVDRSNRLEEEVGRGVLDLAVVLSGDQPTGVSLGELKLFWFAAPGFEPAAPWPLVAFEEPCGLRRRALTALEAGGHSVAIAAESTSLEGVLAATRAGLGVALLPSLTGIPPAGLVPFDALPDQGYVGLNVVSRRGSEPALEKAAYSAAFLSASVD